MLLSTESLSLKAVRQRSSAPRVNLPYLNLESRKFRKKRKKNCSNLPIREKIGSKRPIDFKKTLYNISVLFFKNFSMKEKIQKAREFLTDIAKAAASENLDGLAEILKAADDTLEALRQDAENVEVTAEAQKAKIAELEKAAEDAENADESNKEEAPAPVTEETQKDAVLSVFSDSVESLLKDLADGIKTLSARVDNIDQALQKASQPTQSRQDEDEAEDKTITKSNRLSALNKRLGAF